MALDGSLVSIQKDQFTARPDCVELHCIIWYNAAQAETDAIQRAAARMCCSIMNMRQELKLPGRVPITGHGSPYGV
jgi:hypothetical protein